MLKIVEIETIKLNIYSLRDLTWTEKLNSMYEKLSEEINKKVSNTDSIINVIPKVVCDYNLISGGNPNLYYVSATVSYKG